MKCEYCIYRSSTLMVVIRTVMIKANYPVCVHCTQTSKYLKPCDSVKIMTPEEFEVLRVHEP